MTYSDGVATLALVVSVVGTFASGYISYQFGIRGEKRKEYNLVADRMSFLLIQQRESVKECRTSPEKYNQLMIEPVHRAEFHALVRVSDRALHEELYAAFFLYETMFKNAPQSKANTLGTAIFPTLDGLIRSINELLKYCAHK